MNLGLASAFALLLPFSIVAAYKAPTEVKAGAITYTYVADTSTQISKAALVSGAKYLFCQYVTNNSLNAYEVMDGATTSAIHIPFFGTTYSTVSLLVAGASSQASKYVTLTHQSGDNWYIQRNSDGEYLMSNGSSDLCFTSSSTYSSSSRCYFTAAGTASATISFNVYGDTKLFLGTKTEGAYFDTWHDQTNSVAQKDFILYRVYDQQEEAANYATSFNNGVGSVCSSSGNTSSASLNSEWTTMSTSWSSLSSAAKSVITSATASSDSGATAVAQCKAKYTYIVSKYASDSSITDFMGLGIKSQSQLQDNRQEQDKNFFALTLFSVLAIGSVSGCYFYNKSKGKS
jgi:hypothetical protein